MVRAQADAGNTNVRREGNLEISRIELDAIRWKPAPSRKKASDTPIPESAVRASTLPTDGRTVQLRLNADPTRA